MCKYLADEKLVNSERKIIFTLTEVCTVLLWIPVKCIKSKIDK